ncbi:FKBP-type peptidyl-prolyl cis-trans isomerase [Aeromicrobium sp.]|uniref:FKBP-type peptidyl-prolyl cis-trans isomerase n=1 Tax=Aeromicrobium sp. TaxID=1871063 RepID=UPI0019957070|nr:FKBP-type peptidyl-prolyl cis-trans isomerase [Aeromicrobium sp.]MBC7631758.1 FKBP-type peptidyl-prolyl cis-trans isomerase [Aeromicrobium sp.]
MLSTLKVVLVRRILLVTAAASLLLAGCGGSDTSGGGDLGSIKVSSSASPKVTVAKGFSATKTGTKVPNKGSGDAIKSGDAVKVNYVAVNGRSGKQFDSSFTSNKPLTLTLVKNSILPGFIKGLSGQKIGSRVLVAIPPKDGFGKGQKDLGVKKNDTMVFLFDIVAKIPTEVTGTAQKLPSDLPSMQLDAQGHPSKFAKTAKTAKAPTKESANVVIQGKGATVKAGQSLTAQYVGQVYPDGAIFDESWSSSARTFQVGSKQLIKCWDDQLVGQKLGTRVVLVCPADKAYGAKPPAGGKIKAGDSLIFAIDLLDAS